MDFTDRHLNPKVGSITFIDNNRDGKYDQNDVLLVTDIRNIVVQGVNIAENEIYDKYDFNNNLKIDVTDRIYIIPLRISTPYIRFSGTS